MKLPSIQPIPQVKSAVDAFDGYYHNLRCGESYMYDMDNMTTDGYPSLRTAETAYRLKKLDWESDQSPKRYVGMTTYNDTLWVLLTHIESSVNVMTLYGYVKNTQTHNLSLVYTKNFSYAGEARGTDEKSVFNDADTFLRADRSMSVMGGYLLIFPDCLYLNVTDSDDAGVIKSKLPLERSIDNMQLDIDACDPSGSAVEYGAPGVSDDYYFNTDTHTLWRYYQLDNTWKDTGECYVCVTGGGAELEDLVTEQAGELELKVTFSLNGTAVSGIADTVINASSSKIVLKGEFEHNSTIYGDAAKVNGCYEGDRIDPMDFVFECNNRLWGCVYTTKDGKILDEIRCSALGDFRKWADNADAIKGTSMDAWTATRPGTERYTGGINYNGNPIFFREHSITKVSGYEPSSFAVTEYDCDGAAANCGRSLAIVNGVLYYRSINGIARYDGSLPSDISDVFCGLLNSNENSYAFGAAFDNKYYVHIDYHDTFIYDVKKGYWSKLRYREYFQYVSFAESLIAVGIIHTIANNTDTTSAVMDYISGNAINGVTEGVSTTNRTELTMNWSCETGYIYATKTKTSAHTADRMYLSKITIRAKASSMTVRVTYDDDTFETVYTTESFGTNPVSKTIHIVPKRKDHLRLRIYGVGQAQIDSITKTIERGSDVT